MSVEMLAEILKTNDNLQKISFTLQETEFTWYFKYLTLLEKIRIEQMCVKLKTTIKPDGSKVEEYENQEHMAPIHTIIEKALDENGKRLFSHTNPKDISLISNLPVGLGSYIAYEMSVDIFGSMKPKKEDE